MKRYTEHYIRPGFSSLKYKEHINTTLCYILNEKRHVYKRNDYDYVSKIIKAIKQLLYNNYDVKYIKFNNGTLYKTLIIDDLMPRLEHCKIFLGINSQYNRGAVDAINISAPGHNVNDYTTDEVLYKKSNDGIEIASIIITVGPYDPDTYDDIIAATKHELIHIMHNISDDIIESIAGLGYVTTEDFNKAIFGNFDNFPTEKNVHSGLIYSEVNSYIIMSAIMYYMSTSEYSAWLDSFNEADTNIISRYMLYNKDYNLEIIPIYKIISGICNYLELYKVSFINDILKCNISAKERIALYIKQAFNKKLAKSDLSDICNSIIKKCKAFLQKADIIHKGNLENYIKSITDADNYRS